MFQCTYIIIYMCVYIVQPIMIAAEVKLEPCVTMAPSNLSDPRCSQKGAASGPSMWSTPIVQPIQDDSWLSLNLGCKIHQISARVSRNSANGSWWSSLTFSDTNFCLWIPYGLHWLPQGPLLPRHMEPQNSGWLMQHLGTFGIFQGDMWTS